MTSLQELALEYRASADLLERRLCLLGEQARTARGEQALDLERRIAVLREELREIREVTRQLSDYYR